MLTIKAEIKRQEQKVDGTYNVKLRFTLNRQVKRLSTSLFVKPTDLTKSGNFKKGTAITQEIDRLVLAYQAKCNEMQVDLNNYSLEYIFKRLKFEDQKSSGIDFIAFSRQWIATATIKGACNYTTVINTFTSFLNREQLPISEFTTSLIARYAAYLNKRRESKVQELKAAGKRIPSNRMLSLYLGSLRHLFKEAQKAYNDYENNLILIPYSPFDNYKIPKQEVTRKRAIDRTIIKQIYALSYKNQAKGHKGTCRQDLARDCFILSFCLIGINSADLFYATDFDGNTLTYNRAKTKDRRLDMAKMSVSVPQLIKPLFDKYKDKTGKRVFNFYQFYTDKKAFNKAINYGLKQIGEQLAIDDLEYYAARHSWATIALNKVGIDKYTVHAALNHVDDSMKVTDIYIQRDFVNENKANAKVMRYVFNK